MIKRIYGGLNAEFWVSKPLIGMVHLMPLPGSPRDSENTLEEAIKRAIADSKALEEGGADAIMIENFFDAPFVKEASPPHTIAAMTRAVLAVKNVVNLPLGVNVLRNDSFSAIAIAHVCGAQFVRVNVWVGAAVTDQGIIEGAARKAILYRKELGADVAIFADIFVKHAAQLASVSLEDAAKDAFLRGLADGLIVSGTTTGASTPVDDVRRVKQTVPDCPVLIGSGFNAQTASELLQFADGAIVGTSLKTGSDVSAPINSELVRALKHAMASSA